MSHIYNEPTDLNPADFQIFASLVGVAGLTPPSPDFRPNVTLFLPNDDAFVKLAQDFGADIEDGDEAGALAFILGAADALDPDGDGSGLIAQLLLYHMSPFSAYTWEFDDPIQTLAGPTIDPQGPYYGGFDEQGDGPLFVDSSLATVFADQDPDNDDAALVGGQFNVDFDGGPTIIQVIDEVLLPVDLPGNEPPTIWEMAIDASGTDGFDKTGEDFDILIAAAQATGLDAVLDNPNADITLFAPNDRAFVELVQNLGFKIADDNEVVATNILLNILDGLDDDGDGSALLAGLLLYHISPGAKMLGDIGSHDTIDTALFNQTIENSHGELIDNEPGLSNPYFVEGQGDNVASNGVVHVIDGVLIPVDLPAIGNEVNQEFFEFV